MTEEKKLKKCMKCEVREYEERRGLAELLYTIRMLKERQEGLRVSGERVAVRSIEKLDWGLRCSG
jgi:hypothetical protein